MPDFTKLDALVARLEEIRKELKANAEKLAADGTREYFQKHGDIVHSFGWNQYTPSFCDGDPCTFTMGEPWILGKAHVEEALADDEYPEDVLYELRSEESQSDAFNEYSDDNKVSPTNWNSDEPNPNYDPRYAEALADAVALYKAMSFSNLAEEIFGEYATVIFSESGVETEYYEPPY